MINVNIMIFFMINKVQIKLVLSSFNYYKKNTYIYILFFFSLNDILLFTCKFSFEVLASYNPATN